jgi:hypothetical protein
VFIGVAALVVLQAVFIYAPIMHKVFGSAPLGVKDLALAIAAGMIILPVISVEKFLRSRSDKASAAKAAMA